MVRTRDRRHPRTAQRSSISSASSTPCRGLAISGGRRCRSARCWSPSASLVQIDCGWCCVRSRSNRGRHHQGASSCATQPEAPYGMTIVLTILGVVVAVFAAMMLAVARDIATSEARGWLLRWSERLVARSLHGLPEDQAQDMYREFQADLRVRFAERGPISGLLWAWGIAREAAPAIARDVSDLQMSALRRVGKVGNRVNATIGLVAFSWLMAWASLSSIGQSVSMTTSGHYTEAAWIYAVPMWAMFGFMIVLSMVGIVRWLGSLVSVRWDHRRWWRVSFVVGDSISDQFRGFAGFMGAMLVVSIFHRWMSNSANVLLVPGVLGGVLLCMCARQLGAHSRWPRSGLARWSAPAACYFLRGA